jgi:hypothetical protein
MKNTKTKQFEQLEREFVLASNAHGKAVELLKKSDESTRNELQKITSALGEKVVEISRNEREFVCSENYC